MLSYLSEYPIPCIILQKQNKEKRKTKTKSQTNRPSKQSKKTQQSINQVTKAKAVGKKRGNCSKETKDGVGSEIKQTSAERSRKELPMATLTLLRGKA